MPNVQQLAELILSVQGAGAVADLRAKLDANRDAMNDLTAAYARGDVETTKYVAGVKRLGTESAQLAGLVDALEKATHDESEAMEDLERRTKSATAATRAMGDASEAAAHKKKAWSGAMLEASRAIEDFATGGPIGGLNNLPGIVERVGTAIGANAATVAAWTSGIGIAGTAAFLLYQHWDKLKNLFEAGIPRPVLDGTEDLKRKIEAAEKITDELGKKTRLSLDEFEKYKTAAANVKSLNAELAERQRVEAMLAAPTEKAQANAAGFRSAVTAAGGTEAKDALVTALRAGADAKGRVRSQSLGEVGSVADIAQNLLDAAGTKGDPSARDEIVSILEGHYKGGSNFAKQIRASSPEGKAAKDLQIKNWANDEERLAKAEADRKEKEAWANEDLKALAEKKAAEESKRIAKAKADKAAQDELERQTNIQRNMHEFQVGSLAGDLRRQGLDPRSANRAAEAAVTLHRQFGVPAQEATNRAVNDLMNGVDTLRVEYARVAAEASGLRAQAANLGRQIGRARNRQPTRQDLIP